MPDDQPRLPFDQPRRRKPRAQQPIPTPREPPPRWKVWARLLRVWAWRFTCWAGRTAASVGNKVVVEIGATIALGLLVAHFGFDAFGLMKSKVVAEPRAADPKVAPSTGWEATVKKNPKHSIPRPEP
jgi:hypothetical protein